MVKGSYDIYGLDEQITCIDVYTKKHPELQQAHHFLYNLPLSKDTKCGDYIVMGINPGEGNNDWVIEPDRTQETSKYDFHEVKGKGRKYVRWNSHIRNFLPDTENVIQTELCFWSSKGGDKFTERFGELLYSEHLSFCTQMNKILLDHYKPKAVIFPGLSVIPIAFYEYGLDYKDTVLDTNDTKKNHRLVVEFYDGQRPWIFTKHWSGSRGFSGDQKQIIKNYISVLSQRSDSAS